MKINIIALLILVGTFATSIGCSKSPAPSTAKIDGSQYKLSEEPDGAVGVIIARESAEDGVPLVLVGRIGGSRNPWIDGRAAFSLLDASMNVVADGTESSENELCMDDCCALERKNCTTIVKILDESGKVLQVDSRELLGLKESDMVVVQGTAQKDKAGNFVMLAKGIYIRN